MLRSMVWMMFFFFAIVFSSFCGLASLADFVKRAQGTPGEPRIYPVGYSWWAASCSGVLQGPTPKSLRHLHRPGAKVVNLTRPHGVYSIGALDYCQASTVGHIAMFRVFYTKRVEQNLCKVFNKLRL